MNKKMYKPPQRKIYPDGKKLLGYPESYEGPRMRVTTMQNGVERYVYEDGTFDPNSTVLTKRNDTFAKAKQERGKPAAWIKVAEGKPIIRMPITNYVQLVHELPHNLHDRLSELDVEKDLGRASTAQTVEPVEIQQAA